MAIRAAALIAAVFFSMVSVRGQEYHYERIVSDFSSLREKLNIPGLTVAVAQNGEIVFSEAFGYRDLITQAPMTENTVFHTASITKTFTAYVLGLLEQDGKISMRDEVKKYNLNLGEGVRIEHLLSHTSLGIPGKQFYYHSGRFNKLDTVIYESTGKFLSGHITDKIIRKIPLTYTFPNPYDTADFRLFTDESPQKFIEQLYTGYIHGTANVTTKSELEKAFAASAGLMSTSTDLVRYGNFLMSETNAYAVLKRLTRQRYSPEGESFPYSLGWFTEYIDSVKFVWHYGYMGTNSSLLILVPEKKLTFAILANSNNLSRIYPLEEATFTASEAGLLFLKHFLPGLGQGAFRNFSLSGRLPEDTPDLKQINNLLDYANYRLNYYTYGQAADSLLSNQKRTVSNQALAVLSADSNNLKISKKFLISQETSVRFISSGEGIFGPLSDYGFCTDTEGKVIWSMQDSPKYHAGGNAKNLLSISDIVTLLPGDYTLHYLTDESHSPEFWNNLPPDDLFWGIYVMPAPN